MSLQGEKKTVITGYNLICPIGSQNKEIMDNLLKFKSNYKLLKNFNSSDFSYPYAGKIENFQTESYFKNKKNRKFMNKICEYVVASASISKQMSLLNDEYVPERRGIYTGSGETGMEASSFFPALEVSFDKTDKKIDYDKFGTIGFERLDPYLALVSLPNNGLCYISIENNIKGPNSNYIKSAVSSAQAIGMGCFSIKEDLADMVFIGGYDSLLNYTTFLCYEKAGLLSIQGDTPNYEVYTEKSSGIIPSEAAGTLIVEDLNAAKKRRANIYAEVKGYSEYNEAYAFFDYPIKPVMLEKSINKTIRDSNLNVHDIDLILTTGSGIKKGDNYELTAIKNVFSDIDRNIKIYSPTPTIGYTGAAIPVVNTIIGLEMLNNNPVIPFKEFPGSILNENIPGVNISLMKKNDQINLNTILLINYGIGGQVATFILARVR